MAKKDAWKQKKRKNTESKIHQIGKHRANLRIGEWLSGKKDAPLIARECKCGKVTRQPFPKNVSHATIEYPLFYGKYYIDVCLMDIDNAPIFGIEILWSHQIPYNKAEALTEVFPWIEVEARALLAPFNKYKVFADKIKDFDAVRAHEYLAPLDTFKPVRASLGKFKCKTCGQMNNSKIQRYRRFYEIQDKERKRQRKMPFRQGRQSRKWQYWTSRS